MTICVGKHLGKTRGFQAFLGLALIFSVVGMLFFTEATQVWADEVEEAQQAVDQAQSTLDSAEQHMDTIVSEYDALKQEIDQLQERIDAGTAQALEAQQAVIAGRVSLSQTVVYEYRDGDSVQSFVTMVLGSNDFSELLQNLFYLDRIMQYQSDEVAAQKERADRFEELVNTLNVQKNEQDTKFSQLEAKKAEAEQVAVSASSLLQNAQSDQASRLAALQQKADEMAAQGAVSEPVEVDEADTPDRQPVVPDDAIVEPDPAPSQPGGEGGSGTGGEGGESGGNSGGSSGGDSNIGWSTGVASAYGGATDPYTPNPGITATGAVCDDNSMGVAVPMAWPNYWQYYGRTVEISYGGTTVFATVNDCGSMGGGSRSLDLQPGVWKAFGFSSCIDWGVRTVSYRFL